jgi:hypothetical protein
MSSLRSLESARRPRGLWICGQRKRVAHKPHRPNNSKRSGHLMCYKTRTSSRATDSRTNITVVQTLQQCFALRLLANSLHGHTESKLLAQGFMVDQLTVFLCAMDLRRRSRRLCAPSDGR